MSNSSHFRSTKRSVTQDAHKRELSGDPRSTQETHFAREKIFIEHQEIRDHILKNEQMKRQLNHDSLNRNIARYYFWNECCPNHCNGLQIRKKKLRDDDQTSTTMGPTSSGCALSFLCLVHWGQPNPIDGTCSWTRWPVTVEEQVQIPQHDVSRHPRPCLTANMNCRTLADPRLPKTPARTCSAVVAKWIDLMARLYPHNVSNKAQRTSPERLLTSPL